MARLFWRGKSLWLDIPNQGHRYREPVIQRTSDAPGEIKRCEKFGNEALMKRLIQFKEGKFFDIEKPKYDPKFWRIAGRYWWYHLRLQKSGKIERPRINVLLRNFGRKNASEITRNDVEIWLHTLKRTHAVATVNRLLAYFKRVFVYSITETDVNKRLHQNPILGIKSFKGENVRNFLLDEFTFEKCLKSASPAFRPLLLAAWETGRRPEELKALQWPMVDLKRRIFMIPAMTTKTGDSAEVPISDRLFNELRPTIQLSGFVFRNTRGKPWKRVEKQIALIRKAVGDKRIWFRDTRRAFVTRKVEVEGHDYFSIMSVTGHKTISTFKRYHIGSLEKARRVVGSSVPSGTNLAQELKIA